MLQALLQHDSITFGHLRAPVAHQYPPTTSTATRASSNSNLNVYILRKHTEVIIEQAGVFCFAPAFEELLANTIFKRFLADVLQVAHIRYAQYCQASRFVAGFFLYQKYSRRDVSRILNWAKDETATLFGYKEQAGACPLFVNYHKAEDIAQSTNYEEHFLNHHELLCMSKSNRRLTSKDMIAILNTQAGLRLPLFTQKHNGEGEDFYYMGDVIPN